MVRRTLTTRARGAVTKRHLCSDEWRWLRTRRLKGGKLSVCFACASSVRSSHGFGILTIDGGPIMRSTRTTSTRNLRELSVCEHKRTSSCTTHPFLRRQATAHFYCASPKMVHHWNYIFRKYHAVPAGAKMNFRLVPRNQIKRDASLIDIRKLVSC